MDAARGHDPAAIRGELARVSIRDPDRLAAVELPDPDSEGSRRRNAVEEEDRPPVRGSVEDDRRPEPREIAGSVLAALEQQVRVLGARNEQAAPFSDVLQQKEV